MRHKRSALVLAAPTFDRRPRPIWAEVSDGLPSFAAQGLPDGVARELRERLRAAILNQGFEFPIRRVTVGGFGARRPTNAEELAAAVAILLASGQATADGDRVVAGALRLDGTVRWGNLERLADLREGEADAMKSRSSVEEADQFPSTD